MSENLRDKIRDAKVLLCLKCGAKLEERNDLCYDDCKDETDEPEPIDWLECPGCEETYYDYEIDKEKFLKPPLVKQEAKDKFIGDDK